MSRSTAAVQRNCDRAVHVALRTLSRLASAVAGQRLGILIFHRVLAQPDPFLPDTPDGILFESLMHLVAAHFHVVALDDAVSRLRQGALRPGSVAITFDDGYSDNATIALPLLRRLGLHATFFVTTGYLDGGRMWNDSIIEVARTCPAATLDLRDLGLDLYSTGTTQARLQTADRLISALKYRQPQERIDIIDAIATRTEAVLPDDLMMTTAQVRSLRAAGMSVGAHTLRHPILTSIDEGDAWMEIFGGKQALEAILSEPVTLFAYPNGKPERDYRHCHVDMVRKAGFVAAVSTEAGVVTPHADFFQLPRFTPYHVTPIKFCAQLVQNFFRTQYRQV
jgi:peptidoglycan/xylan/chitin deacetylase (PgdA/CDA1 family)